MLEPIAFGVFAYLVVMWGTDAVLSLVAEMVRWLGGGE